MQVTSKQLHVQFPPHSHLNILCLSLFLSPSLSLSLTLCLSLSLCEIYSIIKSIWSTACPEYTWRHGVQKKACERIQAK